MGTVIMHQLKNHAQGRFSVRKNHIHFVEKLRKMSARQNIAVTPILVFTDRGLRLTDIAWDGLEESSRISAMSQG
ncbi:MAG TPA: hypothetical protein VK138_09280 [Acidiferrobacterales bacterium]|nr:hypothetical protein [Acidiferrobacterales bacterium]